MTGSVFGVGIGFSGLGLFSGETDFFSGETGSGEAGTETSFEWASG